MIRVFIIAAMFVVLCGNAIAQPANRYSKLIKARAEKMCAALISHNYTEFIKFMPLSLIKAMGDKKALMERMKKGDEETISEGFLSEKVTIGEPGEIVDTAHTLQCLVPQTLQIKTPHGHLLNHSHSLAISWDRGVTWFFAGINTENVRMLKAIYPALSSKMIPPETTDEIVD